MIDTSNRFAVQSYAGELEIIGNGIAPMTQNFPLKLKVGGLEFEFLFKTKKGEISKYSMDPEGKKLIINLFNFNNSLGTGVLEPLQIGHLEHRRLYISFWVWTPDETEGRRVINWTLYLGEPKADSNE